MVSTSRVIHKINFLFGQFTHIRLLHFKYTSDPSKNLRQTEVEPPCRLRARRITRAQPRALPQRPSDHFHGPYVQFTPKCYSGPQGHILPACYICTCVALEHFVSRGIVYWSRSAGVMSGSGDIRLLWESRALSCTTAASGEITCPEVPGSKRLGR